MIRRQTVGTVGGRRVALLMIRDGRHPFVVMLLLGCLLAGLLGIFGPTNPNSPVDQYVLGIWRDVYYWALAVASSITLVGVWLRDLRDRLMVEQIGLWFLSAPLMVYPIAILTVYRGPLGVGGSISCLIGLGGLIRVVEIIRELRAWAKGIGDLEQESAE